MKKKLLICLLALSMTAALAGCKKAPVETEPPTETETETVATETETETQKPTETEKEDSMNKTRTLKGLVKASDTNTLTIQTERGKELKFTTTGADMQLENGIKTGNTVTILYKGKIIDEDTSGAKVLMVVDLDKNETPVTEGEKMTEAESSDPNAGSGTLTGTIYDMNTDRIVVLSDDGELYYFTVYGTKMNLVNGLQDGNYVTVEYTGDIYGPDLVQADVITDNDPNDGDKSAPSSPSSQGGYSYLDGTVVDCGMSTTTIMTDSGEELSFDTSNATHCYTNGIAVGNYITIEYTGELNGSDTTGVSVAAVYDYADNAASTSAADSADTSAGMAYRETEDDGGAGMAYREAEDDGGAGMAYREEQ